MGFKMKNQVLNNKRILYISGPCGRERWMLKISKEMEKRYNSESFYCATMGGENKFFVMNGISKERIHSIIFPTLKRFIPNLNFIKTAEEKYSFNCWDVWQITAPRKKARMMMTPSEVLREMEYVIRETENMIEKFKPDYVLYQGPASFVYVILCNIISKKGIKLVEIANARIPGRFALSNNLENKWPLLIKEYDELKKRKLTLNETNKAEEFINIFKEKQYKPDDCFSFDESFKVKVQKYKVFLNILRYRKKIPNVKFLYWHPLKVKFGKFDPIFDRPVKGEKYVYYPLHLDPETSTSLFGKWYVNQLSLLENISKSLPCDYKLYVKEHIYAYPVRKRNYYRELKKYPNIRLLSPFENSFDLINNSSMILTITGTTGWEAILLQKPVITFGNVYYNAFDKVIKIKEIEKLPLIIRKNLEVNISKEDTYKFIIAMLNSTLEGIGVNPADCQERCMADENISKLVDGIELYLQRFNN